MKKSKKIKPDKKKLESILKMFISIPELRKDPIKEKYESLIKKNSL